MSEEGVVNMGNFQEKIGYGHGQVVGFSEDGMVFMTIDTKDGEGRPMQMFLSWDPERAEMISKSLLDAAGKARKAGQLKLESEQSNVRPDSNRVN